ncbi:hypothetical protein PGT21_035548 [Puccinia graminis f. sp. tritici]|nr:hypothetical protein PGT21_035548 [Puccinia graminis f. sp. tritici]
MEELNFGLSDHPSRLESGSCIHSPAGGPAEAELDPRAHLAAVDRRALNNEKKEETRTGGALPFRTGIGRCGLHIGALPDYGKGGVVGRMLYGDGVRRIRKGSMAASNYVFKSFRGFRLTKPRLMRAQSPNSAGEVGAFGSVYKGTTNPGTT